MQRAEYLGLRSQRHVTDLIKKDGATVAKLKLSNALIGRAREGAFLVTEEFTLNEVLRYCRTVDCDVGLLCAKAILENSLRNQLLARATLSSDHNSDIASRDLTDHLKNLLHS